MRVELYGCRYRGTFFHSVVFFVVSQVKRFRLKVVKTNRKDEFDPEKSTICLMITCVKSLLNQGLCQTLYLESLLSEYLPSANTIRNHISVSSQSNAVHSLRIYCECHHLPSPSKEIRFEPVRSQTLYEESFVVDLASSLCDHLHDFPFESLLSQTLYLESLAGEHHP